MVEAVPQGQGDPASYHYTETGGGGSAAGTLLNWTGAVVSLALVAGLGVWGYKLTVRDVSGVPVVRALEGPMRVLPTEPGGKLAAHQGLAVNAVQADGSAEAPADRIVLAPQPARIDDALPLARVLEEAAPDATPNAEDQDFVLEEPQGLQDIQVSLADTIDDLEDPVAAALALAERLAADSDEAPLAPLDQVAGGPKVVASLSPTAIPTSVQGVKRSPRPLRRPAGDLVARNSAAASVAAEAVRNTAVDVDPDSIAAGTRLVQLGAFDSAEVAQSEWARLSGKFGQYMEGKQRVVQRASSGGRIFFRLRAMGFADLNEARRFCSALTAGNAACIPVVTR